MNKCFYYILLIIVTSLFVSCKKKALLPKDYINWVENKNNGLYVEKEIGKYVFELYYKPIDYLILRDLKNFENIDQKLYEKEKSEREGLQYYVFKIRLKDNTAGEVLKEGLNNTNEYYARIEYFSFGIQQDLMLVDNHDTLVCVLHHFERTYGLTPDITMTSAFQIKDKNNSQKGSKGKDINNDRTFIYNDRVIGAGTVKLTIKEKDIKEIPNLIIK